MSSIKNVLMIKWENSCNNPQTQSDWCFKANLRARNHFRGRHLENNSSYLAKFTLSCRDWDKQFSHTHTLSLSLLGRKWKLSHEFLCNPTRCLTEHVCYVISERRKDTRCQLLLPLFMHFLDKWKRAASPLKNHMHTYASAIFRL